MNDVHAVVTTSHFSVILRVTDIFRYFLILGLETITVTV